MVASASEEIGSGVGRASLRTSRSLTCSVIQPYGKIFEKAPCRNPINQGSVRERRSDPYLL